jgi:aminoglycoside 3-N-acetyltransferase
MTDRRERIESSIRAALAAALGAARAGSLAPDDALLAEGLLDSFGFLELVMGVEATWGQAPDFEDMDPAHFTTISGLASAFLRAAGAGFAFTPDRLAAALEALGIGSGAHLFVHAAFERIGWPVGGLDAAFDTLQRVVGPEGTIAAPTFTFPFCRGVAYVAASTPSLGMGVLAEHIRRHPAALRTRHPIQSMSVVGRHAARLAGVETQTAYGADSAFAMLPPLGFRLLLLGASPRSVSLVHLAEETVGVPYRSMKTFAGSVDFGDGAAQRTASMYVRDLAMAPDVDERRVSDALAVAGRWHETPLNHGRLATALAADYHEAACGLLRRDPFALLTNADAVRSACEAAARAP